MRIVAPQSAERWYNLRMAREDNEFDPALDEQRNQEELERFSGIPTSPPIAIGVFAALFVIGIALIIWIQMPRSVDVPTEETAAEVSSASGTNVAANASSTTNSAEAVEEKYERRLVFYNGKKIVRHDNGLIEIPVVFSCEGADVKPFWAYEENPEAEAAKELKAREEWVALCKEAQAQRPAR